MAVKKRGKRGGLGALGARLLSAVSAKPEEVFSVKDAEKAAGMKGPKLRKLLHDLAENKWIERIERGKYLAIPLEAGWSGNYGTHPFAIARKLIAPYYIGFASALNYRGVTEQVGRTTFVATTKKKTLVRFHAQEYKFVSLPEKRFFGFTEEWMGRLKVGISDEEKTVVDCLFLPEYSGGLTEVAKAFRRKLDFEKLCEYALKMDDLATVKRLGCLLDVLGVKTPVLKKLLAEAAGGYCLLDPTGPKNGFKNRKWRVLENVSRKDLRQEA